MHVKAKSASQLKGLTHGMLWNEADGKSRRLRRRPAERDALNRGSGHSILILLCFCREGVKRAYKPKQYNHEGDGAKCKMNWPQTGAPAPVPRDTGDRPKEDTTGVETRDAYSTRTEIGSGF